MTESAQLLKRFETQQISAPDFHHKDHILVAFEMLKTYDFIESCTRYASTIREMAEKLGVPEKYNATITIAFLSVIAERQACFDGDNPDDFITKNPDLLGRNVLMDWYTKKRLTSATARRQFVLPDRGISQTADINSSTINNS